MTLPTGKSKGFTLLELLIVVGMIAALAAVATPLFRRTASEIGVRSVAHELWDRLALAQERAIAEKVRYQVSVSKDRRAIQTAREALSSGKPSFEKTGGRFGRPIPVPADAVLDASVDQIIFHPDGAIDPARWVFKSPSGKSYTLTTADRLGQVLLREGLE